VLRKYADDMFDRAVQSGLKNLEDYKVSLIPYQLKDLIGEECFN
jgi:predicted 2-oxoglutarate/Fe(II)-dependent dioxygenase YbiX